MNFHQFKWIWWLFFLFLFTSKLFICLFSPECFFKVLVFWFWFLRFLTNFIVYLHFHYFLFFDVDKYFTLFHILNQCICMLFHLLLVYLLCFIDNLNTHSIRSLFNPIFAHTTVRKSTKYCIDNYYHYAVSMTNWTTVNYILVFLFQKHVLNIQVFVSVNYLSMLIARFRKINFYLRFILHTNRINTRYLLRRYLLFLFQKKQTHETSVRMKRTVIQNKMYR